MKTDFNIDSTIVATEGVVEVEYFRRYERHLDRLKQVLTRYDQLQLLDDCLLSSRIREEHSNALKKKCNNKRHTLSRHHKDDLSSWSEKFRFVTLLDQLVPMDMELCMDQIQDFKMALMNSFIGYENMWVLGVIEVEPIAIDLMRQARSVLSEDESRKLDVFEEMIKKNVDKKYADRPIFMLIHFHGIMYVKNKFWYGSWEQSIRKNPRWKGVSRGLLVTPLSSKWRGKERTLKENMDHICEYMSKAGMDKRCNSYYFKYKFDFNKTNHNQLDDHEKDWCQMNDQITSSMNLTNKNDVDILSWTPEVIYFMARLTNRMRHMSAKSDGFGQLIFKCNRRKKVDKGSRANKDKGKKQ